MCAAQHRTEPDPAAPERPVAPAALWLWCGDAEWTPYGPGDASRLEAAYQEGRQQVQLNEVYVVSLESLVQFRINDPTRQRAVRRVAPGPEPTTPLPPSPAAAAAAESTPEGRPEPSGSDAGLLDPRDRFAQEPAPATAVASVPCVAQMSKDAQAAPEGQGEQQQQQQQQQGVEWERPVREPEADCLAINNETYSETSLLMSRFLGVPMVATYLWSWSVNALLIAPWYAPDTDDQTARWLHYATLPLLPLLDVTVVPALVAAVVVMGVLLDSIVLLCLGLPLLCCGVVNNGIINTESRRWMWLRLRVRKTTTSWMGVTITSTDEGSTSSPWQSSAPPTCCV
eukprot:m51a1_g14474 hypothetical protein (341) ;mRNA; r:686979-688551